MWRKLLRALGCLSYLTVLLALFAVISYIAFSQFVRRGVTPTPELFGMAEEEARALLADQGLGLEWTEGNSRFDDQVPPDHVLLQRPRAGALVKRGGMVTVVMSRGPQLIEVPTVVGDGLQAAQVSLQAAGLRAGRTLSIFSPQGLSGTVVAQQPEGGQLVERDAAVDLFLTQENVAETFLMPDLVNKNYDDVRLFFEARGFRLGRVSYEDYAGVLPGTVLRQYPLPGHPLRYGDVISLGVVPPAEPVDTAADEVSDTAESSDPPTNSPSSPRNSAP